VAVAVDMSVQTIWNYEKGNVLPSVATSQRIEKVLGLPSGSLLKSVPAGEAVA
jgi:transcriptional regulator with XRE-family HTH domain